MGIFYHDTFPFSSLFLSRVWRVWRAKETCMKLKYKILLGFAALIMLLLVIEVSTLLFLQRTNTRINQIVEKQFATEKLVQDSNTIVMQIHSDIWDAMLFGKDVREARAEALKESGRTFYANIRRLEELLPEQRTDFNTLSNIFRVYFQFGTGILEFKSLAEFNRKVDVVMKFKENKLELISMLNDTVSASSQKFEQSLVSLRHDFQRTTFLTAILTGAIILLGVTMSLLMSSAFTRPIAKLMAAIKAFEAGDLDAQAVVRTRDELGSLAKAFNTMGSQLKENIQGRERLLEEVKQKNIELEHFDQLKDEFLANTSHELRTPLNGIIGIADSMLDGITGKLNVKQQQNLSLIVSSGRRLMNLVNDILDFSKLRHQDLHLERKAVDMHSVTEVVLTVSRIFVEQKEIELVNRIVPDLPAVDADEDRVQQILYNLVGNGIKFTEVGQVAVSAVVENGVIAITVSDTGIGIPKEKQSRIFESFEQADGSIERQYGGTGLGLAVTRQLVELHGGTMRVASEPGNGSEFTFTLPLSDRQADPADVAELLGQSHRVAGIAGQIEDMPISAEIPVSVEGEDLQQMILIVDDEPVNLQVLKNQLSVQRYAINMATNGHDALAVFERGIIPDLVLLDVMMPGMSGYEVCRRIRETWAANELPVVMLTAKNRVADLVTGFEAGANDYLVKPFSKEELLARIKTHLNLKNLVAENVRMGAEMELAQRIQTSLLPHLENHTHPELDIAAVMLPADEVGGDYYDVLYGKDGTLWLGIGDVSGHGVTPGLIMMMAQTIKATVTTQLSVMPKDVVTTVNQVLYHNVHERLQEDHFMTFTSLKYHGQGRFLHAGAHLDLVVHRAATGTVELIDTPGAWLNFLPDIEYATENAEFLLDIGDALVLYTDGLTEARNGNRELLDIQRFQGIVTAHAAKPIPAMRDAIVQDVLTWCDHQRADDMSLVVVRRVK